MSDNSSKSVKIWNEIDRIQLLIRQMENEAEKLQINIERDTLYIALISYISGLRTVNSM